MLAHLITYLLKVVKRAGRCARSGSGQKSFLALAFVVGRDLGWMLRLPQGNDNGQEACIGAAPVGTARSVDDDAERHVDV